MAFAPQSGASAGSGHRDAPIARVVPAVAGYVHRLEFAHVEIRKASACKAGGFMLAQRLSSVGRLNVPVGKRPRLTQPARNMSPPVPSARLGAKPQRLPASGCRVLKRNTGRRTAIVIPFPGSTAASGKARKAA